MTIKVKYHNGIFEPLTPMQEIELEEGAEFEIEILMKDRKNKLKSIIGLLADQSAENLKKFEDAVKRRPLFER
jgi:predicted DNA-binding antitoxin AbrB/MazE fold protein